MADRYLVRGPNGSVVPVVVPSRGMDRRTFDRRVALGEFTVLEGDTPVEPPPEEPVAEKKVETVDDILTRVGDDSDRARAALNAEQARGEDARSTLISALEKIASEEG